MKPIKMICRAIDTFTEWTGRAFAFITLITLGVIIFEVFMRRILNRPQIWTMDMIVMSFGCYVVLTCAFGFLRRAFVAVDVVYAMLPGIVRHILHLITYTVFFIPFSFKLAPVAYRFFLKAYTTHELSYSVWQPPTWPVKLALFVGLTLLCIQGISEILKHVDWVIEYFRNGRKEPRIEEGPSAVEMVILENGGRKLDADLTEDTLPSDEKPDLGKEEK